MVAALTKRFGDLDIAEEAAAEAFATAVVRWPVDGVPPNPGAWLTTTANRKAIDRIRRENKRDDKQREAQLSYGDDQPDPLGAIDDARLRLIFTCCHPALAMETRVALTLRMVGGLTVPEIARAFLVQEATMGQRITRAKAKIKAARIPYRVPSAEDLPARVSGVLAVLFLVFNEGYLATGPDTDPVRHDLTAEAIRLTRLIRALMPEDGEVAGLLALMLLTEARRTARVSASGELIPLGEQDRGVWDAALVAEGHRLVRERGSRAEVTTLGERRRVCGHEHETRDLGRQTCCKAGCGRHVVLGVETGELLCSVVVTLGAQRLDHMLAPSRRARAGEVAGRGLVPGRDALQEPAALCDELVTVVLDDAVELAGPQLVVDPTEEPLGMQRVNPRRAPLDLRVRLEPGSRLRPSDPAEEPHAIGREELVRDHSSRFQSRNAVRRCSSIAGGTSSSL